MNRSLANVTLDTGAEAIGGIALVGVATLIGATFGGIIGKLMDEKLMPITSSIGGGIGLIMGLAIKISLP